MKIAGRKSMSALTRILTIVILSFGLALSAQAGNGGGTTGGGSGGGEIAQQTCDTQVWKTMEDRARLETEREIMQNQNLIFKPDSVLSYMCFDSLAGHAAAHVGVLFTHTKYWDGKEIIPWGAEYGMDHAMTNVIGKSLPPYISSNFNHDYLGGRGSDLGLQKRQPETSYSQGSTYGCSEMSKVWMKAKCLNFMYNDKAAKSDGFYPFKNLKATQGGQDVDGYEAKNDIRNWPTPCNNEMAVPGGWKDFTNSSRNSTGDSNYNRHYQYGDPNNKNFTDVRKMLEPGQCGTAVKTGLKIILTPSSNSTNQDDAVCTNPGCTYNGSACTAVATDSAGRVQGGV
jgi:hypothetical protein